MSEKIFSKEFLEDLIKNKPEPKKPDTAKLKSSEIYFEKISELESYEKDLLLKLKENIERGDYQLIIGEDASGRIPALIMRKVINHIYDKHDFPHPQMRFVSGFSGQEEDSYKIQALKDNLSDFVGAKALVVTEHIASGHSMYQLKTFLESAGIECDLASLALQKDVGYYPELGDDLYYAKEERSSPLIYGRYNMGGVHKKPENPYATRHANSEEDVVKARSDIENVANNIIDWYDSLESKS